MNDYFEIEFRFLVRIKNSTIISLPIRWYIDPVIAQKFEQRYLLMEDKKKK